MHDAPSENTLTPEELAGQLSPQQATALSALSGGKTTRQAATQAGVHRNTVLRWIHGDPVFRAAYNAWKQERIESARSYLLYLSEEAAVTVATAVQSGDAKISLTLLRDLGLTRPHARGSTDPVFLTEQLRHRREDDERRLINGKKQAAYDAFDRQGLHKRLKQIVLPAGEQRPMLETPKKQQDEPRPALANPPEDGPADAVEM